MPPSLPHAATRRENAGSCRGYVAPTTSVRAALAEQLQPLLDARDFGERIESGKACARRKAAHARRNP